MGRETNRRGWSAAMRCLVGAVMVVVACGVLGVGGVIGVPRADAGVGDSWVYEVTYGSETTNWTNTVVAEEINSGTMCARIETSFSADPVRMAQGVEITLKESRGWRALSDHDFRHREQKATAFSGWATVDSTIDLSDYTPGHGQPLFPGEAWSYHEYIHPSMGAPFNYDWDAQVAGALESVTVPAGTFNCYRVTYTDRATPSRTITEWWDAGGLFDQEPVKIVDNANFADPQTSVLASYPSPSPAVATNSASDVTLDSASLNGSLDSLGTASTVNVSFQWGLDTSYGHETAVQAMSSPGLFSTTVAGLDEGHTYHFRAKAVGDGTSYGEDRTLITGVCGSHTWHLTNGSADGEAFAIDGDAYIKYNYFMQETVPSGNEASVLIGYRNGDGFGLFDDNDDAWWYADAPADVVTNVNNAGWKANIVYSSTPDPVDGFIGDLTVMIYRVNDQGQLHETLMAQQTLPIPAGRDHAVLVFDNITGPGITTFDPLSGDRIAVRLFGTIDSYEFNNLFSWDWADQLRVYFNSSGSDCTVTSPCSEPVAPVPEATTIVLVCAGLVGLAGFVWLRRRQVSIQ